MRTSITTKSVNIQGAEDIAGAIIRSLCNFGADEGPREPSVGEKQTAIRTVLDELIEQTNWVLSPDSIVSMGKTQEFIQYRRVLKRMDLTNPESVIIPETPTITPADFQRVEADSVQDGAAVAIQGIPGWATWSKESAHAWGMTNIGTPLANGRENLPATLTLATARVVIVQILNVLDAMWVMLWALGQMVIEIRNDRWPGLQE